MRRVSVPPRLGVWAAALLGPKRAAAAATTAAPPERRKPRRSSSEGRTVWAMGTRRALMSAPPAAAVSRGRAVRRMLAHSPSGRQLLGGLPREEAVPRGGVALDSRLVSQTTPDAPQPPFTRVAD